MVQVVVTLNKGLVRQALDESENNVTDLDTYLSSILERDLITRGMPQTQADALIICIGRARLIKTSAKFELTSLIDEHMLSDSVPLPVLGKAFRKAVETLGVAELIPGDGHSNAIYRRL